MADDTLTPLAIYSQPGCKRDGTLLEGNNYVDNQWCRYQMRRGLPRKMGGYRRISNELFGVVRGMNVYDQNLSTYVHTGWSGGLQRFLLDMSGNVSSIADRTPAGFTTSANNLWQFDYIYDGSGTTTALLASCAPNLSDITASTEFPVYYGNITSNAVLAPTLSPNVSGGVFALGPYAVSYGNNGIVNYSPVNNPNSGAWTSARPAASKLVFGTQIRAGAGNGPSGLIWGVDQLLRMTFVGSTTTFNFDSITTGYSLLSSQGIIEYDGIYYWPGIDRFQMFNGVIQELENGMNLNWFYDNLNYAAAQKIFAFKVPRWGEIWWCYPRGSATECTHAVIYNPRLSRILGYNVWYDTQLPNSGRSCGQYARVFRSPLMTGVALDGAAAGYTKLWQHEYGTDEVDGTAVRAVRSFFETNAICPALPGQGIGNNSGIYVDYIEPDFVQTGDMTVAVKGSMSNARAPDNNSTPQSFPDSASSADTQLIYLRQQRRQMRFNFESNVAGGNYEMGDCIAQVRPGDARITS